jgi:hypothetical protein
MVGTRPMAPSGCVRDQLLKNVLFYGWRGGRSRSACEHSGRWASLRKLQGGPEQHGDPDDAGKDTSAITCDSDGVPRSGGGRLHDSPRVFDLVSAPAAGVEGGTRAGAERAKNGQALVHAQESSGKPSFQRHKASLLPVKTPDPTFQILRIRFNRFDL